MVKAEQRASVRRGTMLLLLRGVTIRAPVMYSMSLTGGAMDMLKALSTNSQDIVLHFGLQPLSTSICCLSATSRVNLTVLSL